jgi:glycosyltransferase involved in cell wall biosynthesis
LRKAVETAEGRDYEGIMISVIIATWDDETRLAMSLAALVPAAMEGLVREVIVVDRGSRDGTAVVADAAGCRFLEAPDLGTDARRLAAGEARADWLLFLPPGAVLETGWQSEAMGFLDAVIEAGTGRRAAACFRLGRMEPGLRARLGEVLASFRTWAFAAPHEEQGLLVSAALYRSVGGHRDIPAFADIDLARRIGRRRLSLLRARTLVRTQKESEPPLSARFRNAACLALLVLRFPPSLIGRLAA